MIEVRLARSATELEQCLRLRWTVFVEEQGVRPSDEQDARDRADAVHALALLDGLPCGTGRFILEQPGLARIQRMAVIDDVRGHGVGRALLAFLEAEAARRGATWFTLAAQTRASDFYEKAGYRRTGAEFDDGTGIPHVRMDKRPTAR